MNKNAWRVQQQVQTAWTNAIHHLTQISQWASVRPRTPNQIFILDRNAPDDTIKFLITPTVFLVSERSGHPGTNLFVVVDGWLSFKPPCTKQILRTCDFGTRVAYFREKHNSLDHIFGAHYDMDEKDYRHPVFHAQISSQMEYASHIKVQFSQEKEICDCVNKLFRTVRIPTAQMDIFSVLVQICADHLIGPQPAAAVTTAFDLKNAVGFFIGAAHDLSYLNSQPASSCYRGHHWYN